MATAYSGTTGVAILHDGRRITFAAVGPDDGFPIVYCHGVIGSPRWRTPELDALTQRLGIRYLLVNRPGFGGSDPCPGRNRGGLRAGISERSWICSVTGVSKSSASQRGRHMRSPAAG